MQGKDCDAGTTVKAITTSRCTVLHAVCGVAPRAVLREVAICSMENSLQVILEQDDGIYADNANVGRGW